MPLRKSLSLFASQRPPPLSRKMPIGCRAALSNRVATSHKALFKSKFIKIKSNLRFGSTFQVLKRHWWLGATIQDSAVIEYFYRVRKFYRSVLLQRPVVLRREGIHPITEQTLYPPHLPVQKEIPKNRIEWTYHSTAQAWFLSHDDPA